MTDQQQIHDETPQLVRIGPVTNRPVMRKSQLGAAIIIVSAISLVIGVLTGRASTQIGPHNAVVSVTLDDRITADFGPLGAVVIDTPLPTPLGVHAQIREIPAEFSFAEQSGILLGERETPEIPAGSPIDVDLFPVEALEPVTEGLLADAAAYAQLAATPEAALRSPITDLVFDILGRATLIATTTLVLAAAVHAASPGRGWRITRRALRRPAVLVPTAAVAVSLVTLLIANAARPSTPAGQHINAFSGTALADAQVTGRLGDVLDVFGMMVRNALDENERFYSAANANLLAVLEDEPNSPASSLAEDPEEEFIRAVFHTDTHCNVDMGGMVGTLAESVGADLIIDGGDTTASGTDVERYCIDGIDALLPDDTPVVVAAGNHDSVATEQQMRDAGWVVLDGGVETVADLRFLGISDPRLTSFGQGTTLERDEDFRDVGFHMADVACEDLREGQGVDVLLLHNPYSAAAALNAGCAPLSLSGDIHRELGPEIMGHGLRFVGSSTGGAAGGGRTIGPVENTAYMYEIEFDAETGQPLSVRDIRVSPTALVEVGYWRGFPEPPPLLKDPWRHEQGDLPDPEDLTDELGETVSPVPEEDGM